MLSSFLFGSKLPVQPWTKMSAQRCSLSRIFQVRALEMSRRDSYMDRTERGKIQAWKKKEVLSFRCAHDWDWMGL